MQNHYQKREDDGIEPLLLRIPEVARCLGISRAKVYELIGKKMIPTIHIGRAVRVSMNVLRQLITELENEDYKL